MNKSTVSYCISKDEYIIDNQKYIGYGITVITNKTNKVLLEIKDITTSQTKLYELVKLCNELHLDPIHIYDVVEDFLS